MNLDIPQQPGNNPGFSMVERSAANRLVKASKCPTNIFGHKIVIDNRIGAIEKKEILSPGTYATLSYRAWSDEWRITCNTAAPYKMPPAQGGRRETKNLTSRGARAISESCEFVALKQGGYRTFLTLTFDSAARARMLDHETQGDYTTIKYTRQGIEPIKTYTDKFMRVLPGNSLQREVSRFFDGVQKIYQRGFKTPYQRGYINRRKGGDFTPINFDRNKSPGAGQDKKLSYCWVAEAPLNDQGKPNPHVHVLLAWEIDFSVFPIWARRIEKLWGQGFAHLEKIKSRGRKSASAYIAKAAKYISKGEGQGTIKGNRYGISKTARAPAWEGVKNYAWHSMGSIIEKTRLIHKNKTAPARQARSRAQWVYDNAQGKDKTKAYAILQNQRTKLEQAQGGMYLTRCSITAQGWEAMDKFLSYAERCGWLGLKKPPSLYFAELQKKAERREAERKKWEAQTDQAGYWQGLFDQAKQYELAAVH